MARERRVALGYNNEQSDEPGIAQQDDGSFEIVAADGSRSALVGGGGGGPFAAATVAIVAADLLALADAPVELVAGVADSIIFPLLVAAFHDFGSVQYAMSGNYRYFVGNTFASDAYGMSVSNLLLGTSPRRLTTTDFLSQALPQALNDGDLNANAGAPFQLDADANPSDGDGTLRLTTYYSVYALSE